MKELKRYVFVMFCGVLRTLSNILAGDFCKISKQLKVAISSEYASYLAKYFKNLCLTTSALWVTSPFKFSKTPWESVQVGVYFRKGYKPTDCSLIEIKQIRWLFR